MARKIFEHGGVGKDRLELADALDAVHARQANVEQDDIGLGIGAGQGLERVFATLERAHPTE
jgi:hypothetical protein